MAPKIGQPVQINYQVAPLSIAEKDGSPNLILVSTGMNGPRKKMKICMCYLNKMESNG